MVLTVRNMQSDSTVGWICRANNLGLKVTYRPGKFGGTIYFVKSAKSFVEIVQDLSRGRKLKVDGFNPDQLAIVTHLQDCGLICKEDK